MVELFLVLPFDGNLKFGSKPGDKVVDFGAGKSSDGTGEGVPGEVSHLPSVLGFGVWRFIDDKLGRKQEGVSWCSSITGSRVARCRYWPGGDSSLVNCLRFGPAAMGGEVVGHPPNSGFRNLLAGSLGHRDGTELAVNDPLNDSSDCPEYVKYRLPIAESCVQGNRGLHVHFWLRDGVASGDLCLLLLPQQTGPPKVDLASLLFGPKPRVHEDGPGEGGYPGCCYI